MEEDIFTNNKEAIESLRKSAEFFGINPDLVAKQQDDKKPRFTYVAKRECKYCYGKGVVTAYFNGSRNTRKPQFAQFDSVNSGTRAFCRCVRKIEL